ncbi:hypothetical protein CR513_20960, partial [Mucuna pruriens]
MVTTNYEVDNFESWYLDTRCSNHMTRHKYWLIDLDDSIKNKEEAYVLQPPRFEVKGNESKVYKLREALYGLKQVLQVKAFFYVRESIYKIGKCEVDKDRNIEVKTLYKKIVGSLRFLCNNKLDISFGVGKVLTCYFERERGTMHKKLKLTLIQIGLETKWTKKFGHESNCTWKKQSYRNKKFHFLRDQVSKEKLKLVYCSIELHVANVFTKSLKLYPFKKLGELLEVVSLDHLN